jgi:hypothetical protein
LYTKTFTICISSFQQRKRFKTKEEKGKKTTGFIKKIWNYKYKKLQNHPERDEKLKQVAHLLFEGKQDEGNCLSGLKPSH